MCVCVCVCVCVYPCICTCVYERCEFVYVVRGFSVLHSIIFLSPRLSLSLTHTHMLLEHRVCGKECTGQGRVRAPHRICRGLSQDRGQGHMHDRWGKKPLSFLSEEMMGMWQLYGSPLVFTVQVATFIQAGGEGEGTQPLNNLEMVAMKTFTYPCIEIIMHTNTICMLSLTELVVGWYDRHGM